jgi:hypothetical protein
MAPYTDPIPNSPFSYPRTYSVDSPLGGLVVGSGLAVDQYGNLLATSLAGGTVTSILVGTGLSGGLITSTGTINLLPPTGSVIGGVKAGANVTIAADGTISVAPPGVGTITAVTAGAGLSGGGIFGAVTLSLQPATNATLGGIIVGSGFTNSSGSVSLAQASTASIGGVRLATAGEVVAGIDALKAVTPQTLAAKVASTTDAGLVQLNDSVGLTNSTQAATPTAVKFAYDAAVAAQTTASASLPKAGGTMTGVITFAPSQTFPGVAFPVATANSLGVVSVGPGLSVNSSGVLSTANNGTVTAITAGPGLGAPVSGSIISTSGTMRLLPPTTDGLQIGGVKAGPNINITPDGTISVPGTTFLATGNEYAYNGYVWPVPDAFGFTPGSNGQVLTIVDKTTGTLGWTNTGTLTAVTAGTGISVSNAVPGSPQVSLANTTVVPDTYGGPALIPFFSVNAQGQITSAGLADTYAPFKTASFTVPPNLVLDMSDNSTNFTWILTGPTAIAAPVGARSGQVGSLLLTQDPTNPHTVTWASNWKFANSAPYGGNLTLASVDLIQFVVVSPLYIVVTNIVQNIG